MEFRTQALFTGLSDTRWGFTPPIMSHPADRQPPLEGPPPAPTFYAGAQARAEREMNATLEQPVTSPPQQTAAASPASRAPVASATISNTTNLAHINRRIRAIREELGVLNIQLGELREAAEDGSQVPNSGIAE